MISSIIRLEIQSGKVAEFEALVAQLVRDVHAYEPGVQSFEVRRVTGQPLHYFYFLSFKTRRPEIVTPLRNIIWICHLKQWHA